MMRKAKKKISDGAPEILYPKSDLIFKRIFGDERNIDILQDFLIATLDIPAEEYDKVEIVDPNLRIEREDDKLGILDILVKTKKGKLIDIEIQVADSPYMAERVAFYAAKLLTSQIAAGKYYDNLKKVISIVIADYVLIKDSEHFHNRYFLCDRKNDSLFTDIVEIDTLELPKLPASPESESAKDRNLFNWLYFIGAERKEDFEMVATKSPTIRKAYAVLKDLSEDEATRLLFESHEKARWDEYARMKGSYEKGLAEGERKGLQEGERRKALETARVMLVDGMAPDLIAKFTGLSEDEIRELPAETK